MYDSHIHMYYGPSDSVEEFLQKTAAAGVDGGSIISPYPAGHGVTANCDQRWENRLEMVLSFTSQAPGFRSLFWLDPLEKNFEEQITAAAEKGIDGFKIICSRFYPHDTLPALHVMAECGLPVLFHCGILYSNNCAARFNRPLEFEELLTVKGLRFALAHVGWPWTDEFTAICGEARNSSFHADIYADLTPGTPYVYRQEVLKRLYMSSIDDLPNRVLWGSDAPTNNYATDIVKKDIEWDKKIINDIADPRNIFDVPGFEPETYTGLWEKLNRSNADNFFRKK